jgi:hypothetical protein
MVLFLSQSFLTRFYLHWSPHSCGYLIGHRNFHFYYPDSFVPAKEISPEEINRFLQDAKTGHWYVLGFLSEDTLPPLPGYVLVHTSGESNPTQWDAQLAFIDAEQIVLQPLEIIVAQR